MGAIPVFYVPLFQSSNGHDGVAAAMLSRLGETQEILSRLDKLKSVTANRFDQTELLQVTRNNNVVGVTRCTVGAAKDILTLLETDVQPVEALLEAIRALAGFFYPVENLQYTGELAYYRQREWRIVGNMLSRGSAVTEMVTEQDVQALISLDSGFFGRQIIFPTGTHVIARQCQLYRNFLGQPIQRAIRRVIAPEKSLLQVRHVLQNSNVNAEIVSLESLA